MFTLQGTRSRPCRWVRYAPNSCLTRPSLHRLRPLGVLAATWPTPRLGGWRHRLRGISPLIRPVPTLLGVPSVARLAPMLGGWSRQGTRGTSGGSSSFHARGFGVTKHSAYLWRFDEVENRVWRDKALGVPLAFKHKCKVTSKYSEILIVQSNL
jgi:hypothetical protein